MEALLRVAMKQRVAPEYVEKLLRHFGTQTDHTQPGSPGYTIGNEVEPLTPRELEVLRLIVEGKSNKAIAAELSIAEGTVKIHINNILSKLGVSDRTQAATFALQRGIIHLD